MATVNRLKKKKQLHDNHRQQQAIQEQPNQGIPNIKKNRIKATKATNTTIDKQLEYTSYYDFYQCNPNGISSTSTLFPDTCEMADRYNVPLGFVLSPFQLIQNGQDEFIEKHCNQIPICNKCKAYMNCYNMFLKNKWVCFLCQYQNDIDKNYLKDNQVKTQLNSSTYQTFGKQKYKYVLNSQHQLMKPQMTFIFLIDINSQSASSKMLYYAVAAMKQVLNRPEMDDICVYVFTFDQLVYEYDFSGEETKCTVVDKGILNTGNKAFQTSNLKDIREKLFEMLDSLQEISANNPRKGSNFTQCFEYALHNLKYTKGKFFILQSNEQIIRQQIFGQKKNIYNKYQDEQSNENKKSQLEGINKQFFNKYVVEMINHELSISFYSFARSYKNYKVIHDTLKITNSQLKIYTKQIQNELQRFYYQFYYYLNTRYLQYVQIQYFIISGWYYSAIYTSFNRKKKNIIFKGNYLDYSKSVVMIVNHIKNGNNCTNKCCAIQVVIHYTYQTQNYMCVSTVIQPLTANFQRLYPTIDPINSITALIKISISNIRMFSAQQAKQKLLALTLAIYLCAIKIYKSYDNLPDSLIALFSTALGILKNYHSQLELIKNTHVMDKVLGERNFLQSSVPHEVTMYFYPYLFDLSNLDETMCRQDIEFIYPPRIHPKFKNIQNGIYLLDNGISLYLFIGKKCEKNKLHEIFGEQIANKKNKLDEEVLMNIDNLKTNQIKYFIKYLRQKKIYGWIPLEIVRCGQGSLSQKNFYLNFYQENYSQFRNYKMGVEQFIIMIQNNRNF